MNGKLHRTPISLFLVILIIEDEVSYKLLVTFAQSPDSSFVSGPNAFQLEEQNSMWVAKNYEDNRIFLIHLINLILQLHVLYWLINYRAKKPSLIDIIFT